MTIILVVIVPASVFAYKNYFYAEILRGWAPNGSMKYVKSINQIANDKGIQVELNSVLSDDAELDMGIIIRTSKAFKKDDCQVIIKGDLKINGKS